MPSEIPAPAKRTSCAPSIARQLIAKQSTRGGHALIEAGHRVFYTRTSDLVQRLQAARRDLVLEAALTKLDKFDLIILDDITYAHKDQAETGVLFELIARRYVQRDNQAENAASIRMRMWVWGCVERA